MKRAYCSIGCIQHKSDIENLYDLLSFNKTVIEKFDFIIAAQNRSTTISNLLFKEYNEVWKGVFPDNDVTVFPVNENKGHTFGTIDLDEIVLRAAWTRGADAIYKSANDMYITERILDIPLSNEFGFYYINGFGYSTFSQYNTVMAAANAIITQKYFYPQTNFYIMYPGNPEVHDLKYCNEKYLECSKNPNYNGKPWEFIKGFSSEDLLKNFIIESNIQKKQLLSDDNVYKTLQYVKSNIEHDPSYKNVLFEDIGICHLQYPDKNVFVI